jgi:hypothetical protein
VHDWVISSKSYSYLGAMCRLGGAVAVGSFDPEGVINDVPVIGELGP